jgi:hypothetical protein
MCEWADRRARAVRITDDAKVAEGRVGTEILIRCVPVVAIAVFVTQDLTSSAR